MPEDIEPKDPCHDDGEHGPKHELLEMAKDANDSGRFLLSMFLYLAAFQKSSESTNGPSADSIDGLKHAWELACENKERSLAEYIFELLEPYLSSEEVPVYAERLQTLAFDRLEEMGISRSDIDDIANLISDELVSAESSSGLEGLFDGFLPIVSTTSVTASAEQPSDDEEAEDGEPAESPVLDPLDGSLRDALSFYPEGFSFDDLAGFDKQVAMLRDLGIGSDSDPVRSKLVEMLNYRHGVDASPAIDSMLLRAHAREDANRLMVATVGELGLPAVHMRMEPGFQGSPLLCISTHGVTNVTPMNVREAFSSGGVLVLENLDLWESPMVDMPEDGNPFLMMQLSRGAREAMGLVRAAVDDPNVMVMATSSLDGTIEEFFLELLEPLAFLDIELPDEEDRMHVWMDISKRHPSFRQLNKKELVRLSRNMPRFDIYMAAREALEEAYKTGLAMGRYVPISRENILDKLACYHSFDSEEYRELEEELVSDFKTELEDLDDLLG